MSDIEYTDPWEKYNADEHLARFLDPKNIDSARRKGEEHLNSLAKNTSFTNEHAFELKRVCKTNLYTLCKLLNYNRVSENLHGHFCSWYQRNRARRFKLSLWPRGHFKSSIITIAESVQGGLPDYDNSSPWPNSLGPNIRTAIVHEKGDQASKFLVSIAGHFLSNPLIVALYPECVPIRGKQKINLTEFELPRTIIAPESTYIAMGVGTISQGVHCNKWKLDDLIGKEAKESPSTHQRALDWFDNLQSLFSDFEKDTFDLIGTRWFIGDLYEHAMEAYDDQLLKYIRRVEEPDPVTKEMKFIFPEGGFNTKALEVIKKRGDIIAAQYYNDPTTAFSEFKPEWKRFYEKIDRSRILVPTAIGTQILNIADLDICFLYDPAKTGNWGFIITAGDGVRIFVLEAIQDKMSPPVFMNFLFQKIIEYSPRVMSIEKVLFQELYKYWLEAEMKLRKIYFPISLYDVGNMKKDLRVKALATPLMNGQIYYHRDQKELIKQHDSFGAIEEYHLLDALAQGTTVWSTPFTTKKQEEYRAAEEAYLAYRDPHTGY